VSNLLHFLVVSTGGTIASGEGREGLTPTMTGHDLLKYVPSLSQLGEIDVHDLLFKDSSNMSPLDWKRIAMFLIAQEKRYDAFIILHGTDTMAYTASALSFMIANFTKPVVITGSMQPITQPNTDAIDNIYSSFLFAAEMIRLRQRGITIAFGGQLIHGPRSQKILSHDYTAFTSINYPHLGHIEKGEAILTHRPSLLTPLFHQKEYETFELETSVFLLTLFPGFRARYLEYIVNMEPKAIVIEALGLGGVPHLGESLLPPLKLSQDLGIPVVITTQCVYGGVDLNVYEVGRKTLKMGVISGKDMTREAIITKLMLLLPYVEPYNVEKWLHTNFCDEITLP
jgi:L-asparaginase